MKLSTFLKLTLGFLALALGAVGLLIPVWPTTPFILLALGSFSAMPQLQARILRIKFFRAYYESHTQGLGLPRSTIAVSLGFLWVMLSFSVLLTRSLPLALLLAAVGILVTVHILWMARPKAERRLPFTKRRDA